MKTHDIDLEGEGARAAMAGLPWHSNPYLQRDNMPASTGDSLHEWSRKHDAWQRGFEGNAPQPSGGFAKEALPADLLADLVERHLRGIAPVRVEMQRNRMCTLCVTPLHRHERDAMCRTWDVSGFECGALDEANCTADFRAAVDHLRDRYDVA